VRGGCGVTTEPVLRRAPAAKLRQRNSRRIVPSRGARRSDGSAQASAVRDQRVSWRHRRSAQD